MRAGKNSCARKAHAACVCLITALLFCTSLSFAQTQGNQPKVVYEYLWYEAENMRGFSANERGEPLLNPSYLNLSKDKAPGWGISGPGVSAEWTQGGESE